MYGVHPMFLNLEKDGQANALLLLNQHAMGKLAMYQRVGSKLETFMSYSATPTRTRLNPNLANLT